MLFMACSFNTGRSLRDFDYSFSCLLLTHTPLILFFIGLRDRALK